MYNIGYIFPFFYFFEIWLYFDLTISIYLQNSVLQRFIKMFQGYFPILGWKPLESVHHVTLPDIILI
jgi:hypothetical protein